MILKDELKDLGTNIASAWTFEIECDKCKAFTMVTMPVRSQTQKFIYDMGWRVNSRARKYVHLCTTCARKWKPSGERE